jgi:hypothetical protein
LEPLEFHSIPDRGPITADENLIISNPCNEVILTEPYYTAVVSSSTVWPNWTYVTTYTYAPFIALKEPEPKPDEIVL